VRAVYTKSARRISYIRSWSRTTRELLRRESQGEHTSDRDVRRPRHTKSLTPRELSGGVVAARSTRRKPLLSSGFCDESAITVNEAVETLQLNRRRCPLCWRCSTPSSTTSVLIPRTSGGLLSRRTLRTTSPSHGSADAGAWRHPSLLPSPL
jgi:hypothetical protein